MSLIEHRDDAGSAPRIFRDADDPARALALAIYAETGSALTASRETGVPTSTIQYWVDSEDGAASIESVRLAIRHSSAHKIAGIAQVALDATMERLLYGDEVMDKDGVLRRVKMKGKDAAFIASLMIDKHALITGQLVTGAKIDSALSSLADRLASAVAQAARQAASQGATQVPTAPAPELG